MNKKDKEIEYQNGLTELYEETQEMGRGDFVKMIYDLKEELDIANKKLEKIKKYVTENLIYIDDCDDQDTILSIITEDDLEKIIGGE